MKALLACAALILLAACAAPAGLIASPTSPTSILSPSPPSLLPAAAQDTSLLALPSASPPIATQPAAAPTPQPTPLPPHVTATPAASPTAVTPSPPAASEFPNRPACLPPAASIELARVARVIDGDTIEVTIAGQTHKVRYIGVDTPEIKHPDKPIEALGLEAAAFNQALVEGQDLLLVKDVSDTDSYSRLLRYVFVGSLEGAFVNLELVRQGFAQANSYPPDVACDEILSQAEGQAKADLLGLWSPTPVVRSVELGQVEISTIFYNGKIGNTEPDEYVEISNNIAAVQLEGWTLKDKANHRFVFPAFELNPGQVCRVYTNQDHPEWCGFSFQFDESAIWNNGGDCGYLLDVQGNPVDEFCYQF